MSTIVRAIDGNTDDFIKHLKYEFPIINSFERLKKYITFCKSTGTINLVKKYLQEKKFIDDDEMNVWNQTSPFNIFASIGAGIMPNYVDQRCIMDYKTLFVVCHNRPENDIRWNDPSHSAASMAGPDDYGPGHVFITTKIMKWSYFNITTIILLEHLTFLKALKFAGLCYAKSRNWKNPGLFFHCFPHNSVQSLHLHVMNLDNCGFNYERNKHKNISIDHCIELIEDMRWRRLSCSGLFCAMPFVRTRRVAPNEDVFDLLTLAQK